jgi:Hemerythrin HHE cation binding domain
MHHPPLKRHAALVPFSHDHNVGLYHAKRLRMASGMGDDLDPGTAEVGRLSELTSSGGEDKDVQREGLEEREEREALKAGKMEWRSVEATREAWAAFKPIWEDEIAQHFLDEERTLIPLISDQSIVDRLLAEHVHLRSLVAQADAAAQSELTESDLAVFGELGIALADHIRWEERELFPYVQEHTDEAGLERLRQATTKMESQRPASKARPR